MNYSQPSIPLLSVCLITYNHVNYIRDAIEGVLIQKVNFSWELIIADDFSTDGTRDILLEYKEKHPNLIKLILQEKNVGAAHNWMDLITAPKARYIAYFEGDDYWTDPAKLQKQVDFLEVHPEYVLCFHDCMLIDESNYPLKQYHNLTLQKRDITSEELILATWIPTLTVCFRNIIRHYPPEFYKIANGDTFLFSVLGQSGHAKYQADIKPAAYRIHIGGVWSSLDKWRQTLKRTNSMCLFAQYYQRLGMLQYAEHYTHRYQTLLFELLTLSLQANRRKRFLELYSQIFSKGRVDDYRVLTRFIIFSLKCSLRRSLRFDFYQDKEVDPQDNLR